MTQKLHLLPSQFNATQKSHIRSFLISIVRFEKKDSALRCTYVCVRNWHIVNP